MRRSLSLAALAVAALALPASAAQPTPPSNCVTAIHPASTAPGTCTTLGESPAISGATPTRSLQLIVLSGEATATLTCYGDPQRSVTVTLTRPGVAGGYVEGGGFCSVTVTATAPNTTAVASNTWGYVFK
jgi:hypothetical protein